MGFADEDEPPQRFRSSIGGEDLLSDGRSREESGLWSAEERDERGVVGGRPFLERGGDEQLARGSLGVRKGMELRYEGDRGLWPAIEGDELGVVGEHPCSELCVGEEQQRRSSGAVGGRPFSVLGVDEALLVDEEGAVDVDLVRDGDERPSSGQQRRRTCREVEMGDRREKMKLRSVGCESSSEGTMMRLGGSKQRSLEVKFRAMDAEATVAEGEEAGRRGKVKGAGDSELAAGGSELVSCCPLLDPPSSSKISEASRNVIGQLRGGGRLSLEVEVCAVTPETTSSRGKEIRVVARSDEQDEQTAVVGRSDERRLETRRRAAVAGEVEFDGSFGKSSPVLWTKERLSGERDTAGCVGRQRGGGLVDGFVPADFDEQGSNLGTEVELALESCLVVADGKERVEIGPRSFDGLSMRDRLAAASELIVDKGAVDESSTSSDSSSSESSSSVSSSSGTGSATSLSETGDDVVDSVVDGERDPTLPCSLDKEPVLGTPCEGGVEDDVAESVGLESNFDDREAADVVDERVGANGDGENENNVASDDHEGVSAGDFSEVKGESFDFSYPSYADYSSTVDLADGEMEQKIKKPRKKSCRMGPFLDHPRDSKSSTVTVAKLEWIMTSCCTDGDVEVRVPGPDERPWTFPDGWVCLYDFWFLEYHLWFPLPKLLLAYCNERRIALSQLTLGSIHNVVGALVLAAEYGVHMSLYFLKEIIKITPGKTLTPSSVSDMSRPLMTSWNPYHDRHTVGVPFAPGYKECLAYVESIGIHNWKMVDRARVLRCVAFIGSASWEVRSRMDFSEFPSLSGCFAGGSVTDVAATVSDAAGKSMGVGTSVSTPGVVVGLASAPASFAQSADRRREVRGVSEKSVAAGGKKGGDPKKRPADASLAKEASSSKLRKVAVTTKDAPPPSGAPLVGGVSVVDGVLPADGGDVVFQPFECTFGGTVEDCREFFKKLRMVGDDEGCPLDTSERSEWYIKYARHTTIAAKYVNRLVNSQDAELKVVAAELEKANDKLAAAKGGADRTGEIAAWRRKYEAEKKVSSAAQEEVKALTTRMAVDAERAKKRQVMEEERYQKGKEVLRKRYDMAIARHDDVLATCNSRVDKMRRFVDDQKVVRQAMYGVNQIHGVLDAVKVWRSEGIKIPESKVKHLEGELDVRTRAASLVVPVAFEEKELALIPSFDFSVPLNPVLPSLTEGVEEAALAREKEEARHRSDVDRRRSSDCEGTRRDGGAPLRS
ncbi:hypothetical protein N665_0383s0221 [Sinapis alba]|nr:hypothetical protein N665_0383s0221 [Sinapis alba]